MTRILVWFRDMRLRWKLAVAPVLMVAAALTLGALTLRLAASQERALDVLYHQGLGKQKMVSDLGATLVGIQAALYRSITWQNAEVGESQVKDSVEAALRLIGQVAGQIDALEQAVGDDEAGKSLVADVRAAATSYTQQATKAVSMVDADPNLAMAMLRQAERLYVKVEQAVAGWSEAQKRANETLFQNSRREAERSLTALFVIMAVAYGTAISVIVVVGRAIARGVNTVTKVMARLAEGDKTAAIPEQDRRDEIGEMIVALAVFKRNAEQLDRLAEVHAAEEQASKQRLRDMVQALSDALGHEVETAVAVITGRSAQLHDLSVGMHGSIGRVDSQSSMAAGASNAASDSVNTVVDAAGELSSSITEVAARMAESSAISNHAAAAVEHANSKMQSLTGAANRIGEVLGLISTIARQTNLLALNANIEAASAGVAGRGFAVVAHEVKDLADKTAAAATEISGHVAGIQTATDEVVGAIGVIADTIAKVNAIGAAITSAVEQQSLATAEISRAAEIATTSTTRVADGISAVLKETGTSGGMAQTVAATAKDLVGSIEGLKSRLTGILAQAHADS